MHALTKVMLVSAAAVLFLAPNAFAKKSLAEVREHQEKKKIAKDKYTAGNFYFTDETKKDGKPLLLISSSIGKDIRKEYFETGIARGNNWATGTYKFNPKPKSGKTKWTFSVYDWGDKLTEERKGDLIRAHTSYFTRVTVPMDRDVTSVKMSDKSDKKKGKEWRKKHKLPIKPIDLDTSVQYVEYKDSGILIAFDDKNPTFHLTVIEQLDLVASKKVGKKLIEAIEKAKPKVKGTTKDGTDYKILIYRAKSTLTIVSDTKKVEDSKVGKALAKWHQYNTTFGIDLSASKDGKGTASRIAYNPNVYEVGRDGKRPPYIGLVHEMLHCMHNLQGTAGNGPIDDESKVVGFALDKKKRPLQVTDYSGENISENEIRAEHNVDDRETYTGVLDDEKN